MCGIFGVISKKEYKADHYKELVKVLFLLSESRGKEAAGLAVKTARSIDVLKSPVSASQLVKSALYKGLFEKLSGKIESHQAENPLAIIGHSRLVTNGFEDLNRNNQPVLKKNAICVHNGIIVNDERLWKEFPALERESEVDTEVFVSLLQLFLMEGASLVSAARKTFALLEGSASLAVFFNNNPNLLLATNTGSLYVCNNITGDMFVCASEKYILEQFADKVKRKELFDKDDIQQVLPGKGIIMDVRALNQRQFTILDGTDPEMAMARSSHAEVRVIDHSEKENAKTFSRRAVVARSSRLLPDVKESMFDTWSKLYSENTFRRCTKCLLPETHPFISFDAEGVCNYCRNFRPILPKGEEALKEFVSKYRRADGGPDCILPFSGGRDSTYCLHYVKNILKMNPVAYTYDWGVMTDLVRRNEARICGKLGVEHIIISADIRRKRENIRTNIEAWLEKPALGMIPLFMAGDKQMMYYDAWLRKVLKIELSIWAAGGGCEDDTFKVGLCGVRMTEIALRRLPLIERIKLLAYYGKQLIPNPLYINSSFFDSVFAFWSLFFFRQRDNNVRFFEYVEWDEDLLLSTIIDEYDWELEVDTCATWRIDDGTAPFYNYIYMTVAGFTEFDTFRSVQIRQGKIQRDAAYMLIKEENKPRYESLEWYAQTIGFDLNKAIRRINSIPKFYDI